MKRLALVLLMLSVSPAYADSPDEEIDFLLRAVGQSRCKFIRNGKTHSAREARAHLQSKRRRNAQYVSTTADFINKIASQSSTTGKPYRIRCRGADELNSGDWFRARLEEYRSSVDR